MGHHFWQPCGREDITARKPMLGISAVGCVWAGRGRGCFLGGGGVERRVGSSLPFLEDSNEYGECKGLCGFGTAKEPYHGFGDVLSEYHTVKSTRWQQSSGLLTYRSFPVEAHPSGSEVWKTQPSFWAPCNFFPFLISSLIWRDGVRSSRKWARWGTEPKTIQCLPPGGLGLCIPATA